MVICEKVGGQKQELKSVMRVFSVVKDAYMYAALLLPLFVICAYFRLWYLFGVCFLLCVFVLYFFRDPERVIPVLKGAIVSPADGRIVEIKKQIEEHFLREELTKISIFMSLFDVHVNRVPMEGTVEAIKYYKGDFLPAFNEKASLRNEQNSVHMRSKGGDLVVTQIAGIVARRIVCYVSPQKTVKMGERLGLIKFGSRVDLFLPSEVKLEVKPGDRVKAGTSILGFFEERTT